MTWDKWLHTGSTSVLLTLSGLIIKTFLNLPKQNWFRDSDTLNIFLKYKRILTLIFGNDNTQIKSGTISLYSSTYPVNLSGDNVGSVIRNKNDYRHSTDVLS